MMANPGNRKSTPAKSNCAAALAMGATALGVLALLASCSERRVIPMPAPTPTATQAPLPPPQPAPNVAWQDMPATPGNWTWQMDGALSVASFAGGMTTLTCDTARRTVTLARPGNAPGPVAMTIRATNAMRAVNAQPVAANPPMIAATFPPRDPILDAMAFSRGHFALETRGLPTLYVPSWTEVSRVIEDCR